MPRTDGGDKHEHAAQFHFQSLTIRFEGLAKLGAELCVHVTRKRHVHYIGNTPRAATSASSTEVTSAPPRATFQ